MHSRISSGRWFIDSEGCVCDARSCGSWWKEGEERRLVRFARVSPRNFRRDIENTLSIFAGFLRALETSLYE